MSTENLGPQAEDAARQSLSRRALLAAAGGSAIAGIAGCAAKSTQPNKMGMVEDTTQKGGGVGIDPPEMPHDDQPAIGFLEGTSAVEQFKIAHVPDLGTNATRIHALLFLTAGGDGGRTYLEPIWKGSKAQRPPLPDSFEYQPPGGGPKKPIAVIPREADHIKPHVRIGEPVAYPGAPTGTNGTAGWHIQYNGRICCVTARHVICNDMYNPTNSRVSFFFNNAWSLIADRFFIEPILPQPAWNLWDVGFAAYDHPDLDAGRIFINCQPNYPGGLKPYGYPMGLCTTFATGNAFHKVGAGNPPCCASTLKSYLMGYGNITVWYNGVPVNYQNQLCFDKAMGKAGDSGAVVTSDGNWEAIGVHHAGDTLYTYSSPLFNLGWTYQGIVTVAGRNFPSYTKP